MELVIDDKKYKLPESEYFPTKYPKDKIVLHFTAGSTAEGAYQSWIQSPVQVATAFIVDRDGTAYQCFDPHAWAYHLGIQGKDANHSADKSSIAIEIVNMGPLKLNGDQLCSWPSNFQQHFCGLGDTDKYAKKPYRGFVYYASFPDVQFNAVVTLVKRLTELYGIFNGVIPNVGEFQIQQAIGWKGICTHSDFRSDKCDIGPAWNWERFNEGINQ